MDSAVKNKPINQAKTLAELLPEIRGILPKEAWRFVSPIRQPRSTMVQTPKPMTVEEMRAEILALRAFSMKTPKVAQTTASMKEKERKWNSSTKVEYRSKSHTADRHLKYKSVRKVLDFEPEAKPPRTRATMLTSETPKFPEPEPRAKKSVHIQGNVSNQRNKENISSIANINKKIAVPKPYNHKKLVTFKPATPISNISFKSNSDASFLEKEKEINDMEEIIKALTEESTLENIAEVSPPVSTPFKEYRNVQEFFNYTAESDNSGDCNDTVTCFEKMSMSNKCKREESVIVSLCNMSTVKASNKVSIELNDLLEVEKQTKKNIKRLENGIKTLNDIKESHIKSLQPVRKLINENKMQKVSESEKDITMVQKKN